MNGYECRIFRRLFGRMKGATIHHHFQRPKNLDAPTGASTVEMRAVILSSACRRALRPSIQVTAMADPAHKGNKRKNADGR